MSKHLRLIRRGLFSLVLVSSFVLAPGAKAVDPVCPDGSHLSGSVCVSDSTSIAPLSSSSVESCPTPVSGQTATLNTSTHQCVMSQVSVPASVGTTYSCPTGGVLTGSGSSSTCVTSQVSYPASLTQSYYCPSGTPTASGVSGILDTCVTQVVVSSVLATTTPVWSCNYGGYQATRGGVVYCITADEVDSTPTVVSTPSCLSNATLGANGLCNSWAVSSYPSTSQNIYSCPTGQKLNGAWCQVSLSYSTPATIVGSQYVCPSGGVPDGVHTPPLCQTTSLVSSVAPTITDVKTCSTGVLTGSTCVVTAETKYSAVGSVGYAPCGSPAQNVGSNCIVYRSVTSAASISNGYGCATGTPSGSGSSMICITTFASTVPATAVVATYSPNVSGGVLSNDGTYYYRAFTGNGTFSVDASLPVDVLIVGGGGGGGPGSSGSASGGGGAGGVVQSSATLSSGNYSVVVGAGGASGQNGFSSSVTGFTVASGGGFGGSSGSGGVGGSSGGGSGGTTCSSASATQGNVGGPCWGGDPGAGGGGFGGAGGSACCSPQVGGSGGSGVTIFGWTGAGGGGGGGDRYGHNAGSGGAGGGAGGVLGSGASASVNSGSGGGGASVSAGYVGGAGGSGYVVFRYLMSSIVTNANYYCPVGTLSGSGAGSICITVVSTTVPSVVTYSGTCADGYTLNTTTGFCDSTSVTLGIPVIPTGSYYCSQTDLGSTDVTYSILPYDGSAYNGSSLRTCSKVPPVGFALPIPASSTTFLSSYLCELFKVDPVTGVQTTLDYASDTDNTGTGSGGTGYVTCTLVFQNAVTSSTADGSTDGSPPVDGSGDSSGYIDAVQACFSTTDPSDIVALSACLNNA